MKRRRDGGRHTEIKSWRKEEMEGNKEKEKGGEEKARNREIETKRWRRGEGMRDIQRWTCGEEMGRRRERYLIYMKLDRKREKEEKSPY